MTPVIFAAFGIPFLAALIATPFARAVAIRIAFVDRPNETHKAHTAPIPYGGGIAIAAASLIPIIAGCLVLRGLNPSAPPEWLPEIARQNLSGMASRVGELLGIAACALGLHIVGLIDDRRRLGAGIKLAFQLAAALITSWALGVRAIEALPEALSIAVTVLWILVVTNAFNFLDNMDGLSAGVGAIAALLFAVTALRGGQIFVPMLALVIAGSLLGFLIYNFSPARIFMGDAGSLVVGYLLSVVTILTTFYDPARSVTPLGVVVPIVVLAVPLYDVTSVVVHRLRAGESPFRGDRRHFSHRLVRAGLSPRGAVLTIYLATAATGLPAIILPGLDWTGAMLVLVQCACVVLLIAVLEQVRPEPRSRT